MVVSSRWAKAVGASRHKRRTVMHARVGNLIIEICLEFGDWDLVLRIARNLKSQASNSKQAPSSNEQTGNLLSRTSRDGIACCEFEIFFFIEVCLEFGSWDLVLRLGSVRKCA